MTILKNTVENEFDFAFSSFQSEPDRYPPPTILVKNKDLTPNARLESYIEDYADLQLALDQLHDKTDGIISSKELRKDLGL